MLSQMMAMSDFRDILMILKCDAIDMSLKMWLLLIIFSIISKVIEVLEFSMKYGRPISLRYNLD